MTNLKNHYFVVKEENPKYQNIRSWYLCVSGNGFSSSYYLPFSYLRKSHRFWIPVIIIIVVKLNDNNVSDYSSFRIETFFPIQRLSFWLKSESTFLFNSFIALSEDSCLSSKSASFFNIASWFSSNSFIRCNI